MKSSMVNGHISLTFEPIYKQNSVKVMFILTVSWTSLLVFSRTFDNQHCPLPFSLTNLSKFYWTNNTCSYPREISHLCMEESKFQTNRSNTAECQMTILTLSGSSRMMRHMQALDEKNDLSHKRAGKITISWCKRIVCILSIIF